MAIWAFWRNARIRTKVAASLLVATLGLTWFAVAQVLDKERQASSSTRVATLSSLSVKIGDLLHETQQERGRTAQFMSSKGTQFGTELKTQRSATDGRVSDLATYMSGHGGQLPADVRSAVAKAQTALQTLTQVRAEVEGLSVPTPQVIAAYTKMNSQ